MNLRLLTRLFALLLSASTLLAAPARASDEAADPSIRTGDATRIIGLVDAKVMPNMDFKRMTASAVGPAWRQSNPSNARKG